MSILQLKHISKTYGTYKANDDISFSVNEGSIFGLLGPNGAGKTTLIRIITQIIGADSGEILFNGQPLKKEHQTQVGYMPEERGLYKKMKVGEQLMYLARLKGLSQSEAKARIGDWMEKFTITNWWNKKIEELSKGMQQKVQFIATVVHQPPLLILDEPFSGLDPINTNLIKNEIHELKKAGTSVIFSTHRMEQVEEICEEIALINKGQNILQGSVHDIRQQFKENKYRVEFQGRLPALNDNMEVVAQDDSHVTIRLKENVSPNRVLQELMDKKVEIHGFKEILPSINEIFIAQVSKQEHA